MRSPTVTLLLFAGVLPLIVALAPAVASRPLPPVARLLVALAVAVFVIGL